ncbi:hypothetical protein KC363_g2038 [Hortaea werneckii]|uniref:RfeG n=1 Tax=Hortaea werneckii TaxID=91943 RepID=A0A3M7FVQ7_HORWE|nr:hypothetical protein KC363_g2038 [Hortaea werneckii]RMY92922.1 hypothetical protein D0861_02204 [Hortaea werneckii]
MASREIARQWFVPGDGIDRHVISADIQRYLGNDATVRPGVGTGQDEGIHGYWIKAYRNLTSAMIADLRADSARWRQEQRMTGTRGSNSPVMVDMSGFTVPDNFIEPYVGSSTYQASTAGRPPPRSGDSPSVDGPYGPPPSRGERMPASRMPVAERIPVADRMDIDSSSAPQPGRRYGHPDRGYPSDSRPYPAESRSPYQAEPPMSASFGRTPVTTAYAQDSRYAPSYPTPSNDGAPPGYVRQGNYYVPVSTYEAAPAIAPSRSDVPKYGAGPYGQPPSSGRDSRDPRYGGQPDYSDNRDSRYAYPSPAATVSSVSGRDREPVTSPAPSAYGSMPSSSYDQYGRPVQNSSGQPDRSMPSAREPSYNRDRVPTTSSSSDGHRSSRRRIG